MEGKFQQMSADIRKRTKVHKMPFLAQEHLQIPWQDLMSSYFTQNPEIKDRDAPIYTDAGNPR